MAICVPNEKFIYHCLTFLPWDMHFGKHNPTSMVHSVFQRPDIDMCPETWHLMLKSSKVTILRITFDCFLSRRKSKDYVYGIWVYKALGIWKGYYRVKKPLVSYVKPWTEARNNKYMKYHSKLTYQLSFWNVSRKVDYHAGGKWFIHGPKRRKENQLLSLKHPCWLSLV